MNKFVLRVRLGFFFLCFGMAVEALASEISPNENSKQYFFNIAGNPGWWEIWNNNVDPFNPGDPKVKENLIIRSEWVKTVLETDYQVRVAFSPSESQGCSSITPRLLSYVVGAVTAEAAPKLTYPTSEPEWVKKRASDDLEYSFRTLHEYCGSQSGSDAFINALRQFLEEYKVVIKTKGDETLAEQTAIERQRKMEAEAAAAAALKEKAIKEAKIRADAEIRQAQENRRLALEAEKAAKDSAFKQQQLEAESLARKLEDERRAEQTRQYRLAVKSGRQPINTIRDGAIFYDAKKDDSLIWQPPVSGNNKYYVATGVLSRIEGADYIFEVRTYQGLKHFVGIFSRRTRITKGFETRFNRVTSIVGKYVGTTTTTMTSGETIHLPVFDMAVVGN